MTTTTEFKAKVLFRFVPENDEELDLNEGDVIKVIEKHDDGWCIAVFNGKTGYVPANYLEEIADTSSHKQRPTKPAPPIPQKPKSDQSSPSHSQSNGAAISKKESFASFAKAQKEAPKPPPKPAKHLHPTKMAPPVPPKTLSSGHISMTNSSSSPSLQSQNISIASNSSTATPPNSAPKDFIQSRLASNSSLARDTNKSSDSSKSPISKLEPSKSELSFKPPKELTPELEQQRMKIAQEIYTTEVTYVEALETACNKYYKSLMNAARSDPTISVENIKLIFGNIEQILPLNKKFLEDLEQRVKAWTATSLLGDLFLKYAPFLKLYGTYSKGYDSAIEALNKVADTQWFNAHTDGKLKVESVLITPVQRIPRYTLLLEDLLKHTPEDHPDFNNLKSALILIREAAEHVNMSIKYHKNVVRLTEAGLSHLLAPHRQMIRDATLSASTAVEETKESSLISLGISKKLVPGVKQKKATHHFILFNDMLAIVDQLLSADHGVVPKEKEKKSKAPRPKKKKGGNEIVWPIDLIWLKDFSKTSFEVTGPTKTFLVFFDSADEKLQWWNDIKAYVENALQKQEGVEKVTDPAINLLVRYGKYTFDNGEVYEGWWKEGKVLS